MKDNSKGNELKIQDLIKVEVKLILSDINNYAERNTRNNLECAICKCIIEKNNFPDHILLWNKEKTHSICLHTKCAFREEIKGEINELLKEFDYIYTDLKKQ